MSHKVATMPRLEESGTGHESPEVDLPRTVLAASGIAAMIILSAIVSHWVFDALLHPIGERSATPLSGEGLVLPPSPQLEGIEMMSGSPSNDTQMAAAKRLQSYGWIDRDKGVIRLPIERAMEIAIERDWLPSAPASTQNKGQSTSSGATPGQN